MTSETLDLMPPGTYLIGDPAYIIPDEDWDKFLCINEDEIVKFTLSSGQQILVWYTHTEYGDGEYTASCYLGEHQLGVDSGTIGVVQKFCEETPDSTFEYSTKRAFCVEPKDDEGMIKIGPWEIPTGDSYEMCDPLFIEDDDHDGHDDWLE